MLLEKVLKKLQEQNEMEMAEFKRSLSFIRLDGKDMDKIIKDLQLKGIIEIQRTGTKGNIIRIRGK